MVLLQIDSLAVGLVEVFGDKAHLLPSYATEAGVEVGVVTSHPLYHLLSLALLGLWALVIYSYRSEVPMFLRSVLMTKNVISEEANPIFSSLMRMAQLLAIAVCALLALRIVEWEFSPLPEWAEKWNVTLVVGLFVVVSLLLMLQSLVLRGIGFVCGASEFTHEAITVKNLFLGSWGLIVTLPTLLLLLNHTVTETFVLHFITLLTILALLTYTFKSLLLFRRAKISILIWFLYLCTVEVLPVTLLMVGITRQL
ncbi:MAG: DUF4271 domain-containing protein [Tidjanibacter sp.]|nr:DUF4271 domain-containing protein [Tidjanibacter sp.]